MMVIAISLAIGIIFIAEGVPMAKKKLWKELAVFAVLLGIAMALAILDKLDIPNILKVMDNILSPLGKAVFK